MPKNVIVIGGGIAGLGAARQLLARGCSVTILEAKNRLGGRIHTTMAGAIPVELGAEFVHGRHPALLKAIKEARLTTHDVEEQNRVVQNGKLKRVNLWNKISKIISRINPREPDASFAEFLKNAKLSEQDRTLATGFVQGFDAAYTDRISAHSLRRADFAASRMDGEIQTRINAGYSALVNFFVHDIWGRGGSVITNTAVRVVEWKPGRVSVNARRGRDTETFAADAAVIALPLGVLKSGRVKFIPAIPEKAGAIAGLQMGNVRRISLVFKTAWWEGKKDFGFIHALDEAIPTWWSDPRGPVLTGWAGGPKADAIATISEEQHEALSLKILGKIFSERPSALRKQLVSSHSHDWRNDPHVRGAYSYIPVNGLDLPKLLSAPVDETLFFAGEAAVDDAQTGTVFGALASGQRAAREIEECKVTRTSSVRGW